MCFKPMNTYERDELNPLHENFDYAEFFTKTPKKKHRIGKMLNIKRDQRPSCKEIIETLPSTSTSSARSKTEILQPAALTNKDTNGESSSTQSYAPINAIDHSDSLENESETTATKETTEEGATFAVDSRYINVLILGETGTGKSTFINSIANYYNYSDFDDANAHELLAPIPSTITLWDINGKQRDFSVGTPDKNETYGIGEAATQNVKTYDLPPANGYILRLIDTPGMGDPRGVDKDDENCENILAHLTGYEKLHAICFLVKSNNSRITVLFEYCFKQILSRLDKSASNNIIFLFTNTVSDYYRGGNTYSCLKEILKHIKNRQPEVNINFDRNLFYLDNEAFRILAALHCGIELPDKMIKSAVESWDQSAVECKRLMSYIVGDSSNPPLPPHQLRNTISINEAKRLIDNIFKPLADISDSLEDNIRILESHEKKLSLDHENLEYMKDNLYIPVVNLKVEKLTQPVTTCKSENCVEYIQVEDKKLSHYKQRCHEPCYLKNVPALEVGHPNLRGCNAMAGQENCQRCGCHFEKHMHIYELTTKYSDRIQDKNMVDNIQTKEQAVKATKVIIKDLQDRRELLEKEQDGIIESTAMFAHFIQHNAITPFNEAYKFYIEFQINREKSRGDLADKEQIDSLENMLQKYKAKKAAFDETLDIGRETTGQDKVTAEIVISRINNLHNLDFSGETLKQLMDVTIKCKEENSKRSWAHTSIEFVSKTLRIFKKSVGLGKSKARK